MRHKTYRIAMLVASAVVCMGTSASHAAALEDSRETSRTNLDAVWNYLKPVVFASGKAVRLYYSADCRVITDFTGQEPIPFPATKVQSPSNVKTGLTAIQEIFRNDKNVTVTEDANVIRIRIGTMPTAILQTKVRSLSFNRTDRYNPEEALGTIINSKEVKSALDSLRISTVPTVASPVADPMKGLPHLPALIRNITVDQALDKIAKTWAGEGIVMYGICAESTEKNGNTLFSLNYLGDIVPKGD
jgi:hypothetical protein